MLLAGTIGLFLVLFSTRVPVYDGERLFLHVFPAWAMLIGLGFGRLWERLGHADGAGGSCSSGFLLAQGYGTVALHPFGLSYYNRAGRRTARGRAAGAGADLLERRRRPGLARPAGCERAAQARRRPWCRRSIPGRGS